jgi:hypothetical protein
MVEDLVVEVLEATSSISLDTTTKRKNKTMSGETKTATRFNIVLTAK